MFEYLTFREGKGSDRWCVNVDESVCVPPKLHHQLRKYLHPLLCFSHFHRCEQKTSGFRSLDRTEPHLQPRFNLLMTNNRCRREVYCSDKQGLQMFETKVHIFFYISVVLLYFSLIQECKKKKNIFKFLCIKRLQLLCVVSERDDGILYQVD